jgi:SNF2 family DNA or RNA helicase
MKPYGTLTFDDGDWTLDAEPHVHLRAKRVFGKVSAGKVGCLTFSHTQEICRDLAWFTERYPVTMSPTDRALLTSNATAYVERITRLESLIDPNYVPPSFALALPARTYQAREAAIYLENGALLIGDDVGLGKTAAAICSFTRPATLPAVVVTLTHLPKQWSEEIEKFAPDLHVHVVKRGRPYELPKHFGHGPDVVVINYHKLDGWAKVLGAYARSIVFDEIQELRHSGSGRYNAATFIRSQVDYALGLSATPIYNYGGEIYNILNVLKPGCLGTWREFLTEWCGERRDGDDAVLVGSMGAKPRLKDPKAFGAWAREQFLMIRHTRKEVGRELPDVIRIPHEIDVDESALSKVENAAAELARLILSQSPEALRGEKWHAAEELSVMLRQATGVAKAPYVADFVRLLVESGERVVLCGWHRAVYDIWLSKLRDLNPALYTGSETPADKEAAKQRFVGGQSPVLVLSLRSGAGMNGLQDVCSCIVFGELDWSPGVHEQCIGRLHRDGQTDPVVAYFLLAETGADPAMAEVLGVKRQQVEGLRNPGEDFLEKLDVSGAHAKTLAARYLTQIGDVSPLEKTA